MKTVLSLAAALGLVVLGLPHNRAQGQGDGVELLLPGDEYYRTDLPADPTGPWLVLHVLAGETRLDSMEIAVTAFQSCGDESPEEQSGRAVAVPGVPRPLLLVRGYPDLAAGPVRTAFLDDGVAGEGARIETTWEGRAVTVRHLTEDPQGDQPGTYRINLEVGDRQFELHSDPWDGEGQWRLRWVGDLNRDGWPDLLLDASFKYSVYTTRLFLSGVAAGQLEFTQAAEFSHFAC